MRHILGILAVVLVLALPAPALAAGYTVIPIGPVSPGGTHPVDINNSNQVVGDYGYTYNQGAFLYGNGSTTLLPVQASRGINDAGTITGHTISGTSYRAYVYTAGTTTLLPLPPGWTSSGGNSINAAGHVVGTARNLGSQSAAGFLWDGTTMTQLPSLGGLQTGPSDVNASDTVVGSATLPNGQWRAFVFAAGAISSLAPLAGDLNSQGNSINDAGLIVGVSTTSPSQTRAVKWTNGAIAGLGELPGGPFSWAADVNATGVVVGTARDATGADRAVRWSGGTITDLNTEIPTGSGWQLQGASAVNDAGWITGEGLYNGAPRAFLLVPGTDTTPPSISCGNADGLWHAANVSIACTASDSGSGLANAADSSFSLSTSVAAGAETANSSTGARTVCDNVGNCATAGPIGGNKVDRKEPAIAITVPASTTYAFNSVQLAWYSCSDGGSGVASCGGTVANGTGIDTLTVGANSFTVTAADVAGNTSTRTVQYQVVATPWAQFHNGPDRSGVQPNEVVLDPGSVGGLSLAWAGVTGGAIQASPVLADGIVYAPSDDGQLYAFSAGTGNVLWTAAIGWAFGAPAVDAGNVFVGSDNGNVYAFDAVSGKPLWSFQTGGGVYAAPAVAYGVVYVGSWNATLYALDETTGALLWSQSLPYPVRSPAAVANGTVYIGDGDLLAFDAVSGKQLWAAGLPSSVNAPPAVFKNYVVVGADDGSVHAVDLSGRLLWSAMTTYGYNITGAPAIDGSLVYIGSTDGSLYAFDLASGAQAWSTYLAGVPGGWIWASPAYANGVVYVAASGTSIDALDAQTGNLLWSFAIPDVYSSPAVADGTVYVGADDGKLYAFRL